MSTILNALKKARSEQEGPAPAGPPVPAVNPSPPAPGAARPTGKGQKASSPRSSSLAAPSVPVGPRVASRQALGTPQVSPAPSVPVAAPASPRSNFRITALVAVLAAVLGGGATLLFLPEIPASSGKIQAASLALDSSPRDIAATAEQPSDSHSPLEIAAADGKPLAQGSASSSGTGGPSGSPPSGTVNKPVIVWPDQPISGKFGYVQRTAVATELKVASKSTPTPALTPTLEPSPSPTEGTPTPNVSPSPVTTPAPTPSIPPGPVGFPEGSRVRSADLGLKLEGIMWDDKAPAAIINGRIVNKGDTVNDVKILDIHLNSLDVEFQGRKLTVGL